MRPEITLVLARADNDVIGRDGALPWHIPADLKHFKALTAGKPMIMGRRTFESLPGLLPGRRHIVLTRDRRWSAAGAEVAHDVEGALARVESEQVSVIGGAEIYKLFLDRAGLIELTEVHCDIAGDAFVPPFDAEWRETRREDHAAEGESPAFSFVTLTRSPLAR